MLQRIREALKERSFGTQLSSVAVPVVKSKLMKRSSVARLANMHAQQAEGSGSKRRRSMNKTIVQGIYDRELAARFALW